MRKEKMRLVLPVLGLLALALPLPAEAAPGKSGEVEVWLTLPDQSALLARQAPLRLERGVTARIMVDPGQRYQQMVGFGAAITDASAYLIQNRLTPAQRTALLGELFGRKGQGLGFSFTRLTVGASDFSRSHYSYDDMPAGATDPGLTHFSIGPAKMEVLPTLKAARLINPRLAVMISPWSAPGWMKSTDALVKGTLREDAYGPFARYLARTVTAFAAEVGPIDYLSIQNEPDFEPADYPGMKLGAAQRARIIGDHVGPEFARMRIGTRILEWDHNWDKPEHPLAVLADATANRHIAGVAWHCYAGDVATQAQVRDAYPDKDVFFTECSGGDWSGPWADSWSWTLRTLAMGAPRNWARGVLLWNLALDERHGPHLGGCGDCRGVVTIDSATGAITRNPEYYALGQVSRFVMPGAWRIAATNEPGEIETVAFANPDGSRVLIAFNAAGQAQDVSVSADGRGFVYRLAPQGAATFRWRAPR